MRTVRLTFAATIAALAVLGAGAGAAPAQDGGPLSPARFAAFDSVYTVLVAVEDSPSDDAIADARRVCGALDRSDRLLAITRKGCLTSLKAFPAAQAFAACETRTACRRAVRRLRIVISQALLDARASNRIVASELPPGPCRIELTASRSLLRSSTKFRDGLRLLERGLLTNKRATIRRAEGQILAAGVELAEQPTAEQARETFRRACAPAGTETPPPPPAHAS